MDHSGRQALRVSKYVWFCLAFVFAYLALAQTEQPFDAPAVVVWALFAAAVASGSARTYLALWPRGGSEALWIRALNFVDILLVSLAVTATHGIESDLWLVYFALMTFASLYASASSKRLIDVTVSLLYLLATLPHQLAPTTALPLPVYLRLLLTHLFFLIVVSALARRLGEDAEERNQEVTRLRERMASSEERARIAREVHDSLGHTMVSALLRLELCSKLMERSPEEARSILREEIPVLRGAWNDARDLAFDLRPWDAEDVPGGLAATLRERCRTFAERTGLTVDVTVEAEDCGVRPEAAFGLVRIVQEALTNAARHGEATRAEVKISPCRDGRLFCEIRDDGKGFDRGASVSGMGLATMRERAESLGGTLEVSSAPGRGTTVTVVLPARARG